MENNHKREVKAYIRKLKSLLEKNYGNSELYSPGKISKILLSKKLQPRYRKYAYAVFLSREAFVSLYGESAFGRYETLRGELGEHFICSDINLDSVASFAEDAGSSSHEADFDISE